MTSAAPTAPDADAQVPVLASMERHARRIAAAASAGALVGAVVGGWGSRLAMMLLARLNPQVTGRISDDGFRMGRFTLGDTLGLVFLGTAIGVLGGLVFLAVRGLRFGPPAFRAASMTVGPAVVVGNLLVHTDGIDFNVLEPAWLAVGLFVALPGLYVAALMPLADRWLEEDSWFLSGSRWRLLALASLVPAGPLAPFAATGWVAGVLHDQLPFLQRLTADPAARWLARAALTAIFLVAAYQLVGKAIVLL